MYLQTHEKMGGTQLELSMGGKEPSAKVVLEQALNKSAALAAYSFTSGKVFGDFVLDFYCAPLNLVIAVDPASDIVNLHREKFLKERGMSFLRFEAEQVRSKTDTVLSTIAWFISRYEKLNRLSSLSAPRPAMAIAC